MSHALPVASGARLAAADRHDVNVAEQVEGDLAAVGRDVEVHPRALGDVDRHVVAGAVAGIDVPLLRLSCRRSSALRRSLRAWPGSSARPRRAAGWAERPAGSASAARQRRRRSGRWRRAGSNGEAWTSPFGGGLGQAAGRRQCSASGVRRTSVPLVDLERAPALAARRMAEELPTPRPTGSRSIRAATISTRRC